MSQEFIEIILKLIITAIGAIFTYILVPYIKSHIEKEKLDKIQSYTEFAVRCAEQLFKDNEGAKKKDYVYNYILQKSKDLNINLTEKDIDIIVEGVVNMVKYDYN